MSYFWKILGKKYDEKFCRNFEKNWYKLLNQFSENSVIFGNSEEILKEKLRKTRRNSTVSLPNFQVDFVKILGKNIVKKI